MKKEITVKAVIETSKDEKCCLCKCNYLDMYQAYCFLFNKDLHYSGNRTYRCKQCLKATSQETTNGN